MDLNEIAVFVKVVESGSFSLAGKALGIPNSTVSHKVSTLEKRLGVTLIQRTTRKLHITPVGEAYFQKCLLGLEEIRAAESEIASAQSEPQGLLKITAPIDIGSSLLPAIISKYHKKYPKVQVEVILTDRRVDLLSEGVDLAIRAGELKDSSLIAKKIGTTYFVPVASQRYLKLHGTPLHPKDLLRHQCLQFTSLGESWKLTGPKGTFQVSLKNPMLINHLEMLRQMTIQDGGISFLPTSLVYPDIKEKRLVRLLPDWRSSISPVHFVYPGQKFVPAKLSAFIEYSGKDFKEAFSRFEI